MEKTWDIAGTRTQTVCLPGWLWRIWIIAWLYNLNILSRMLRKILTVIMCFQTHREEESMYIKLISCLLRNTALYQLRKWACNVPRMYFKLSHSSSLSYPAHKIHLILRTKQCIWSNKNSNYRSRTSLACIQGSSVCKPHSGRGASVGQAMQRLMQVTERVQKWLQMTPWDCLPGFSLVRFKGINPGIFSLFFPASLHFTIFHCYK